MNSKSYFSCVLLILFLLCSQTISSQLFTKVTDSPISNSPSDSRSVNFLDVNNDGWDDVFISNGLNGGQDDFLFINNGDGSFSISDSEISNDGKSSVGATFADFDNDGDKDAYITNWYGQINGLFINDGGGLFQKADMSIISQTGTFAETATWGDANNDGWLDLYITNSAGTKHNLFYLNDGQGQFTLMENHTLVEDVDLSRSADWIDMNDDGRMDLLVCNEDNEANDVFINQGDLSFEKLTGVAIVTMANSTQSFSYGDIDNDGDQDLFFANAGYFQEQNNQLFINENGEFLADESSIVSMDGGCSYSSNFVDYDNDGDLDLYVSNGYCPSNLQNFLYQNQGDGTFLLDNEALPDLEEVCSYGAAWGDANNDGFLDLIIANCKNNNSSSQPTNDFYLNNGNGNHWLKINLIGTISNQDAIGAKVQISSVINNEIVHQWRTISSQPGYASQNSFTIHVGLGNATVITDIKVHWPSGLISTLQDVDVNQIIEIKEDITNASNDPETGLLYFSLVPNPVIGDCSIVAPTNSAWTGGISIEIMDSLAKVVQEQQFSGIVDRVILKTAHLPAGNYLVRIYSENRLIGLRRMSKM